MKKRQVWRICFVDRQLLEKGCDGSAKGKGIKRDFKDIVQ